MHHTALTFDLLGFLTLGLLSGFGHCLGMCGPFVLYVSRRFAPPDAGRLAVVRPQLLYGFGRVVTYGLLGAAAGGLGEAVDLAGSMVGIRRATAIVAGASLVLFGAVSLFEVVPLLAPKGGPIFARVAGRLKRRAPGHPFVTGLVLGLLPCGLIYAAVIAAAGAGGAATGGLGLVLFGLGTMPALLGLSLADDLLARHRALINRLSMVFLLVMGGRLLWRGLGL